VAGIFFFFFERNFFFIIFTFLNPKSCNGKKIQISIIKFQIIVRNIKSPSKNIFKKIYEKMTPNFHLFLLKKKLPKYILILNSVLCIKKNIYSQKKL
jgi:hypothetical protein